MSPILGNAIALLAVALLVAVCVRNLWRDARRGGCGGCGGCSGQCSHCAGCAAKKRG
ncbi:MAG: FeoB-associated Cys-rich membrane protein [Oscillospiraceae bacterium]|nr:FeoB-associated Cys-rich membrane protein [Oscillospiraceae bacterium]